jgi:hypothetical protein
VGLFAIDTRAAGDPDEYRPLQPDG